MAGTHELSLAEGGALALSDAALQLDQASDTHSFLQALERNRQVWETIMDVAASQRWTVPSSRLSDYALTTLRKMGRGVSDEHVTTLIDINRQVSAQLAGDDIERIRERAYFIWQERGRPHGQDLDHWLIAELELQGRRHEAETAAPTTPSPWDDADTPLGRIEPDHPKA